MHDYDLITSQRPCLPGIITLGTRTTKYEFGGDTDVQSTATGKIPGLTELTYNVANNSWSYFKTLPEYILNYLLCCHHSSLNHPHHSPLLWQWPPD